MRMEGSSLTNDVIVINSTGEYPRPSIVTTLTRLQCTFCGREFWPSQRHECGAPWGSAQIIVKQMRIVEG